LRQSHDENNQEWITDLDRGCEYSQFHGRMEPVGPRAETGASDHEQPKSIYIRAGTDTPANLAALAANK
jgi:hypothetical protein